MKSRNQNEEKVILLINPLVIKERTNSYGLNNGNNLLSDTTNLGFNDESEKISNPKLDKKNKKINKKDDDINENINTKSKLKLKRRIEGADDGGQKIKKQGINSKKGKKGVKKRFVE